MKSHVSLEQKVCTICGDTFATNAIILDRRLRQTLDHYTVTGPGICETCQAHLDGGLIALIEVENGGEKDRLTNKEANRTGRLFWVKKNVASQLFEVPVEDIAFIDTKVGDVLAGLVKGV